MFKKKEVFIIFALGVLITWASSFIAHPGCGNFPDALCAGGWPLIFHRVGGVMGINEWRSFNLVFDFLFWLLILTGGWWVVKRLILWYKKDNEEINVTM